MSDWTPKPVKEVRATDYIRMLQRRIKKYELRYEVSTEGMREMLRRGEARETAEISKWLTDAGALAFIKSRLAEARSTDGSDSTDIKPSTSNHSNGTRSSSRTSRGSTRPAKAGQSRTPSKA